MKGLACCVAAGLLPSILLSTQAAAQTASGTVNTYARVTSVGGATLGVSSTTGFSAGDTVIVIQMQGASVDRTNSSAHGDISSYGSAGTFEYAEIQSVGGGTVTLTTALGNSYAVAGAVQLVRVADYADVTVSGVVSAPAWNGQTGGVVAIDATGTLTLQSDIDVSTRGFRGGALAATGSYSCSFGSAAYTGSTTIRVGNKGEGITVNNAAHSSYRGHQANGGGGGNPIDAGGGGGGNYGAGGLGGRELSICSRNYGGLGGSALDYSGNNRLFMGGGAGSGAEVSQAATGGAISGGGIILVRATNIVGSGGRLLANGESAIQDDANGADGGGAGGAIGIYASAISGSAITTSVNGGDGGDEANTSYAHGTGGGGGGGLIGVSGGASCLDLSWSADEGQAGVSQLGSNAGDPNWSAVDGDPGTCISNYSIPPLLLEADFSVAKDNGVTQLTSGSTTTYTITVTSAGPDPVTGAVVTDTPGAGITCDSAASVTITGDGVPAGSFTFADLAGAGIALGTLSTGQSTTLSFSCQVN